jgi:hypothetical protein
VGSLGARKDGARNVRADIHLSRHDRMTTFEQLSRVQLIHDGFFRFDVEIELMNLVCASEAI